MNSSYLLMNEYTILVRVVDLHVLLEVEVSKFFLWFDVKKLPERCIWLNDSSIRWVPELVFSTVIARPKRCRNPSTWPLSQHHCPRSPSHTPPGLQRHHSVAPCCCLFYDRRSAGTKIYRSCKIFPDKNLHTSSNTLCTYTVCVDVRLGNNAQKTGHQNRSV